MSQPIMMEGRPLRASCGWIGCNDTYQLRRDFRLPDGWVVLVVAPRILKEKRDFRHTFHDKVLCPVHALAINEFIKVGPND